MSWDISLGPCYSGLPRVGLWRRRYCLGSVPFDTIDVRAGLEITGFLLRFPEHGGIRNFLCRVMHEAKH